MIVLGHLNDVIQSLNPAADPGGGGTKGSVAPPVTVKTSHKNMAVIRGALYFMYLAPPPPDNPGCDAGTLTSLKGMKVSYTELRSIHNVGVLK